jgi:hypothetical protein
MGWITLFLIVVPISICAVERPLGLIVHQVSTYRADLFWFYPGINDSVLMYDDASSDLPIAVCEQDRDNRVAVEFNQFAAPTYICGGLVYILSYDNDPSIPGTPLSPIEVSLHMDDGGKPGEIVSGPVTVSGSGNWNYDGEWLYAELGYIHDLGDPLWLQVRWPSSNPFMPKLGCDISGPDDVSMFGYLAGGEDVWDDFDGHDIMLRLAILRNTKDVSPDTADVHIDSFKVYGRDRLPIVPDDDSYFVTTSGEMLYCRVNIAAIDNYFCVTALEDSIESEPSGFAHIGGTSGCEAPADIDPQHMQLVAPYGQDITAYMAIRNEGIERLWYSYSPGYYSPAKMHSIPMVVLYPSDSLEAGRTDSVEFLINSSDLETGDYLQEGKVDFWNVSEIYLPENVSIHLAVTDETAAGDLEEWLPQQPILHQNFPNPFNSQTVVAVDDGNRGGNVSLRIVDILGRTVTELLPSGRCSATVFFQWNGTDIHGARCPSGIYFYSIRNGDCGWGKMLLVK